MKYLQNPGKKGKPKSTPAALRTRPAAIWIRSHTSEGATMPRKKGSSKRKRPASSTMPKRRHSRYKFRRNPPGVRGIVGMVTTAAQDSLGLIGGRVIARAVPQMIKLPTDGPIGIVARLAVGIVAAIGARRISPRVGEMVLLGAVSGEVERLIKAANVPVISAALGDSYEDDAVLAGIEDADVYGALAPGMAGYDLGGYDESGISGYDLGEGEESDYDG